MIEFRLQNEQEVEAQPVQPEENEAPSESSPETPAQEPEGESTGENEGEEVEGE